MNEKTGEWMNEWMDVNEFFSLTSLPNKLFDVSFQELTFSYISV